MGPLRHTVIGRLFSRCVLLDVFTTSLLALNMCIQEELCFKNKNIIGMFERSVHIEVNVGMIILGTLDVYFHSTINKL